MPCIDFETAEIKKLLIITSSGGGGLIQAANAKEQEARAKNPQIVIVRKDILKDWMGPVGTFSLKRWNGAQISGDVAALKFFIAMQNLFDYFYWPYLFFCTLYTLFKEDADHVIDTQPMGTSAILKALRIYNARKKKNVFLQKVLVDLPTKAATHFFRPIKRLTKKDRNYLKLTTIQPLLEEGQSSKDFWKINCKLSEKEIDYDDVNVRLAFRKYQNKPKVAGETTLFLRYKTEEELFLMEKTWKKGTLRASFKGNGEVGFAIPQHAKVISILLGSQPASGATFNYVKKWLQTAKEPNFYKAPCFLFVFCAEHTNHSKSLFKEVADYVERLKKYPENLSIIPFSFQDDDVIAPLFHRSDITCTRSGGQTAMELMCVNSGENWIHSEAKKNEDTPITLDQLLEGIPGWEAANAIYLQKLRGAKIVTPDTFASHARRLFRLSDKDASCAIASNG